MRFQAKLNIFFAFNVILPITLATLLAVVFYSRMATTSINERLSDRVNTASIIIDTQKQVLLTEINTKLDSRQDLVRGMTSDDPAVSSEALRAAAQELNIPYAFLQNGDGSVLTQTPGSQNIEGCVVSARIPIRSDSINRFFVITKKLDRSFLQGMLERIGEQAAIVCGDGFQASTFSQDIGGDASKIILSGQGGEENNVKEIGGVEYLTNQSRISTDNALMSQIVIAGVPKDEVSSRVSILLGAGLSMVLITLLVATLLAFFATKSITNPLKKLTSAAVMAQGGNLDCRIDIDSRDEIGTLASSFTVMCARLRDYINEIKDSRNRFRQALTYASDMLGSGYDRERLTAIATDTLALATQSSAVGFFTLEPKTFEPQPEAVQLSPPEFFEGNIRRSVEKMMREISKGKIKGITAVQENGYQLIFAPLVIKSGPRGALVTALDKKTVADETIFSIIQSLASQAATAMENLDLNEDMQEMVVTDSLTGLQNIRYFNSRLVSEVDMAMRHNRPVSLVILDLDDFKDINDIYGHQVGDEVLRQVGVQLGASIRKSDVAARYGGEEFALILPETDKETAIRVTEKIRERINRMSIRRYPEIKVRFSAGVAAVPHNATESEDLVKAADEASYKAKRMGKNRTEGA